MHSQQTSVKCIGKYFPENRCYQHIIWRASPHEELKMYELNTVTYGVNYAPFLAIRVFHYIAEAEHDCDTNRRIHLATGKLTVW